MNTKLTKPTDSENSEGRVLKQPSKYEGKKKEMAKKSKNGFDGKKRWGNSGVKGYGVNSPSMMEARKSFSK